MPVRRFETHEAASRALWTTPDDPNLWPRIVANLRRAHERLPAGVPVYPRGLHRFRTLEEAQQARATWEAQRVAAAKARIRR